jgi:hypothetical protein
MGSSAGRTLPFGGCFSKIKDNRLKRRLFILTLTG